MLVVGKAAVVSAADCEALHTRLTELEADIAVLHDQLSERDKELFSLRAAGDLFAEQLRTARTTLQDANTAAQAEISSLRKQIAGFTEQATRDRMQYETQSAVHEAEKSSLAEQVTELRQKLLAAEIAAAQQQQLLTESAQRLAESQHNGDALREKDAAAVAVHAQEVVALSAANAVLVDEIEQMHWRQTHVTQPLLWVAVERTAERPVRCLRRGHVKRR